MKKMLSIILALTLCLVLAAGCAAPADNAEAPKATTEPTEPIEPETAEQSDEITGDIISPLPETLDINNLDDCMVSVSLEKGDAYVDDTGKMQMKLKVYSYELYDMIDVAELSEGDGIIRQGETVKVSSIETLDGGLIRINGGEENGGFDLASNDSTVYYEVGMNDAKAYYELGEATLPVSTEFRYSDESNPDTEATIYYPGDFLTDAAGIDYNFIPNNTSVVIENGTIIKMNKVYMP